MDLFYILTAMSWDTDAFKEKIESEHSFPGTYVFKFIVPVGKKTEVTDLLPVGDISFRNSTNNSYVSITLKAHVSTSDEVVEVYERAYKVEGIIAL